MALYTSYYTRQLALRGDGGAGLELQQEGEKTVQKSVPRRTVDFTGPYITWFEVRGSRCCCQLGWIPGPGCCAENELLE